MTKSVPPTTQETAFSCPYCHAFAHQKWYSVGAIPKPSGDPLPSLHNRASLTEFESNDPPNNEATTSVLSFLHSIADGQIVISDSACRVPVLHSYNTHLSKCGNCKKVALWHHYKLVFPVVSTSPPPCPDMPNDVQVDYSEASAILAHSPRGACALLRLSVEKLCSDLGYTEKTIDGKIGAMVQKGLDPVIQKSLDILRVVGNEAVHPGTMDLRDDIATAGTLFMVVNHICEQMITRPKAIEAMYAKLPQNKLDGIKQRDAQS